MRGLLLYAFRGGGDAVGRNIAVHGGSGADCGAGSVRVKRKRRGGDVGGAGDWRNCASIRSASGRSVDISGVKGSGVSGRGGLESRESFCLDLFLGMNNELMQTERRYNSPIVAPSLYSSITQTPTLGGQSASALP